MKYLQKFRLNHLLPLEKFFYSRRGWMTNKISLLLVVWTSSGCCGRAGVGDASYWEREGERKGMQRTRFQSEPTSAPNTAPIDDSSTRRLPIEPHSQLIWRGAAKRKWKKHKKRKRSAHFSSAVCDQCCWQLEPEGHGGFRMPWLCRLISAGDWLCRWWLEGGTEVQLSFSCRKTGISDCGLCMF